ncbi:MAG: DMT family transporter [Chitinophagales bacterium]|nr:DMT family transporter [Chitinophagales bacterium]
MLFLALSIICSTLLVVIFKLFQKYGIDSLRGIVVNYLVCTLTGLSMMDNHEIFYELPKWKGLPYCIVLGMSFIVIFTLLAKTAEKMGVTVASVAQKICFVIPVIVAILLYGDHINAFKIVGIICALASVYFISSTKHNDDKPQESIFKHLALPAMVFFGSGFCDSMFNYIQKNFFVEEYKHPINILIFFTAFVFGVILVMAKKQYQFTKKDILGGILLGIPNYFSLYFLLLALEKSGLESSRLYPINNIGVVGLSALTGLLLFKEKFPLPKVLGLILALSSIIIFLKFA